MPQIKILAINSSPKRSGKTAKFLDLYIKSAEKLGAKVTRVDLYKEKLPFFSGILGKKLHKRSHIQKLAADADGIVIATPTYWFNEPAVLKNLLDNLTPLEENGFQLEGKVAGFIVYSPQGGESAVLQNMAMVLNQMGMIIPPYAMIFYRGPQDTWVHQDVINLAKRMMVEIEAEKELQLKWDKWPVQTTKRETSVSD